MLGRENDSHFSNGAWSMSGEDFKLPAYYDNPLAEPVPVKAFHFDSRRTRIDWRILHGVDIDRVVRDTDLDALDRVVSIIAFGDIEAEDTRNLTELNFVKIFRLGQLTVEYLLHVQDRLAYENGALKDDRVKAARHIEVLRLRVKEQKEQVLSSRRDVKRVKKTLKTYEALAGKAQPEPKPGVEPPAADALLAWKLEAVQQQARDLQEERKGLQSELAKLKKALMQLSAQGGGQDVSSAVAAARRQERQAADERLRAAVEEERRRALGGELRRKLAESLSRQRDLERQKDAVEAELIQLRKAGLLPGSPLGRRSSDARTEQLARDLRDAENEILALAQQLKHQDQELKKQRARVPLERQSSDLHTQQLQRSLHNAEEQIQTFQQKLQHQEQELAKRAPLGRQTSDLQAERVARSLRDTEEQVADLQRQLDHKEAELQKARAVNEASGHDAEGGAEWQKQRQHLQDELHSVQTELGMVQADRNKLRAANAEVHDELAAMHAELLQARAQSSARGEEIERNWKVEEMERLEKEVTRLQAEAATQEAELQRLRAIVAAEQPQHEQLLTTIKQLEQQLAEAEGAKADALERAAAAGVRVKHIAGEIERKAAPAPAAQAASAAARPDKPSMFLPHTSGPLGGAVVQHRATFEPPAMTASLADVSEEVSQFDLHSQASRGSSMVAPAPHVTGPTVMRRPTLETIQQSPQHAAEPEDEAPVRTQVAQPAPQSSAPQPSLADQQRFLRELRVELPQRDHERPGVRSQFAHPPDLFKTTRVDVQEDLEAELREELESYGIDPYAEGLTKAQYQAAMGELEKRRAAALAVRSAEDQERIKFMRSTVLWHVEKVANQVVEEHRLLPGGKASISPVRPESPIPQHPHPPPSPGPIEEDGSHALRKSASLRPRMHSTLSGVNKSAAARAVGSDDEFDHRGAGPSHQPSFDPPTPTKSGFEEVFADAYSPLRSGLSHTQPPALAAPVPKLPLSRANTGGEQSLAATEPASAAVFSPLRGSARGSASPRTSRLRPLASLTTAPSMSGLSTASSQSMQGAVRPAAQEGMSNVQKGADGARPATAHASDGQGYSDDEFDYEDDDRSAVTVSPSSPGPAGTAAPKAWGTPGAKQHAAPAEATSAAGAPAAQEPPPVEEETSSVRSFTPSPSHKRSFKGRVGGTAKPDALADWDLQPTGRQDSVHTVYSDVSSVEELP
ncbi:hypothetical protein WJX72_009222 [[Myrmecia] bisecta]|uniref:Cilium assembly protein DZIP1 N-terminal domain-containing protein n=1 Tax=[Myrmecia] bisecta TaxID=41462 RepID=A0AAW1PC03_9CHLO